MVEFINGRARVLRENEKTSENIVEINMDVANFSSLIMGSINIKSLYRLGLLEISDITKLDLLENIFMIGQKPLCTVHI